ncbi:MAG: hypothetical protein LRZ85_05820, partial [Alphaproteobacteria bacterium]|nr:hypothetical protein [Alphaproteobacteria bacterium]
GVNIVKDYATKEALKKALPSHPASPGPRKGNPWQKKDRPIITAMADHFERRLKEHKQPGSKAA